MADNEAPMEQENTDAASQSEAPPPTELSQGTFNPNQMAAMIGFEGDDDSSSQGAEADVSSGFTDEPQPDPIEARTQRTFKNKPLAKLGLIGGVTFIIFFVAASFFNSMFNLPAQQRIVSQQSPEPDTEEFAESKDSVELDKALAELALLKQQLEIERGKENAAAKNKKPKPTPPSTPVRAVRTTSTVPKPVARVVNPIVNRTPSGSRTVVPRNRPNFLPPVSSSAQTPAVPPLVAWNEAATVGSYGASQIESRRSRTPVRTLSNQPQGSPSQVVAVNSYEEEAVLSNRPVAPPKTLQLGTRVSGILVTPIAWDESKSTGQTVQPANERFLVELQEDLLADDNTVAMPAGTQLVGQLNAYTPSGLIDASITAVVTRTPRGVQEVNLPEGIISISGKGGRPLVANAKRVGGSGNGVLSIIGRTLFGAGRGIAEELTENAFSVTSNGDSTTFDTNNRVDLAGGALEGFTDSAIDILNRAQTFRSNSQSRTLRYWFAKAGSPVEVVVNRSEPIYQLFGLAAEATEIALHLPNTSTDVGVTSVFSGGQSSAFQSSTSSYFY